MQFIKEKVTGLIDTFVDTSVYTAEIDVPEQPNRDVLVKREPGQAVPADVSAKKSATPGKSILKTVTLPAEEDPETEGIQPESKDDESDYINERLKSLSVAPPVKPGPTLLQSSSIQAIRQKQNTQPIQLTYDPDDILKTNTDTQSTVSSGSDVASMLDFDLTDFAKSL